MRKMALTAFATFLAGIFFPGTAHAGWERVNLEEGIRLSLTSRSKPQDDRAPYWKQVRQTQEGLNASDKRVRSILKKILKENMKKAHKNPKAERLTSGAIGTIYREYPDTEVDDELTYIIHELPTIRYLAIRTYLRVNDHRLEGPIRKVLIKVLPVKSDETLTQHRRRLLRDKFDKQDRQEVYEELIRGFKKAVKNNNEKKQKRLLKVIHDDLIRIVYSRRDFVKFDKLLIKYKEGYESSELRYRQLSRICPPEEPTSAEKYLLREHEKLKQKKKSD